MNNVYIKHYADEDSLTHYGVKGMKWRHHKSIFGLHTGYNEDVTRQLQEAAQVRNMERDAHRNDGSVRQHLGQAGLAARAEAKRRQSASYRVSSLFKKAGKSTLGASKKAVSKGKSIFNSIRSFKKSHPIITHERRIGGVVTTGSKSYRYADTPVTRSVDKAANTLKKGATIKKNTTELATKVSGSNPTITRRKQRTRRRGM